MYHVLIVGAQRQESRELEYEIEGTAEIDGKSVELEVAASWVGFSERHLNMLMSESFAIICLYVKRAEDAKLLLPYLELYAKYPIKVIAHDPSVTVPSDFAPGVPRTVATRYSGQRDMGGIGNQSRR